MSILVMCVEQILGIIIIFKVGTFAK